MTELEEAIAFFRDPRPFKPSANTATLEFVCGKTLTLEIARLTAEVRRLEERVRFYEREASAEFRERVAAKYKEHFGEDTP